MRACSGFGLACSIRVSGWLSSAAQHDSATVAAQYGPSRHALLVRMLCSVLSQPARWIRRSQTERADSDHFQSHGSLPSLRCFSLLYPVPLSDIWLIFVEPHGDTR